MMIIFRHVQGRLHITWVRGSFYVGLLTAIPYEQFSSENESTIFLLPNIHILPLLLCISYCSSGDHKTFDKKKLIVFLILATTYRSTMQPFNNYDELRWFCIVTVIVFFHNLLPYLDMTQVLKHYKTCPFFVFFMIYPFL